MISALAGGMTLGATVAEANDVVKVASGDELAAAILAANADSSIRTIRCTVQGGCDFTGTLPTYTGSQRLIVDGHSSTIDASGITDVDAFSATGGGNVKLMRLTFIGGMSGVYVAVPADATGSQRVELQRVTVRDADLHGVYVDDSNFSNASVRVTIASSKFLDNGFGAQNQDGVRVNETSKGMLMARVTNSLFRGNASDGLSINERSGGNVSVTVSNSKFLSNGANPVLAIDPEDGLDIDEFGPGDVWLMVSNSRFNLNHDDGLDVDESNGGTIFSNLDTIWVDEEPRPRHCLRGERERRCLHDHQQQHRDQQRREGRCRYRGHSRPKRRRYLHPGRCGDG